MYLVYKGMYIYIYTLDKRCSGVLVVVLQEVKLCSPDYKDAEVDAAVADFQLRIKNYELVYEPLDTKTDK